MDTKLANLGPKSVVMLRCAGITSEAQLRALGAARAYLKVKESGVNASLNLLWAIAGALTNRSWQAVAKMDRLALLLEMEHLRSGKRGAVSTRG